MMDKDLKKNARLLRDCKDRLVEFCRSLDKMGVGARRFNYDTDTSECFTADLLFFMIHLIGADGIIEDEEIELLNYIFPEYDFDSSDVKGLLKKSKSVDLTDEETWPSFAIGIRSDNYVCKKMVDVQPHFCTSMFWIYCKIGFLIIIGDGDIDENEVKMLLSIVGAIQNYLIDGLSDSKEKKEICKEYQKLRHLLIGSYEKSSVDRYEYNDQKEQYEDNNLSSESLESVLEADFEEEEKEPQKTLEDYLEELQKLIGLSTVKEEVKSLINFVNVSRLRAARGIKQTPISLHLVFSGNPGTGKTTVARLLANIYREIGFLSRGHIVEVDRSGLVAGYAGQTALKVKEVVESAMGGVLFIDEAYSLTDSQTGNDDYGREAVDVLLKEMEDHRNDLIVIVAGYSDLMIKFLNSNPGLKSRFNKFINFPDYTPRELCGVFGSFCRKQGIGMTKQAQIVARQFLLDLHNNKGRVFANGRDVRNYFEKALQKMCDRVATIPNPTNQQLTTFTDEDFVDVHL